MIGISYRIRWSDGYEWIIWKIGRSVRREGLEKLVKIVIMEFFFSFNVIVYEVIIYCLGNVGGDGSCVRVRIIGIVKGWRNGSRWKIIVDKEFMCIIRRRYGYWFILFCNGGVISEIFRYGC